MAHDVFISYSSIDKPVADAVCAGLENSAIRCWIAPRDILPGTAWSESIVNAIRDCKIMVIIFSANSNQSSQVAREVERAIAKDVIVIPFRIENIPPSGKMEYFLGTEHWLDALTPPLEEHIHKLIQSVQLLLSDQAHTYVAPHPQPVPAPASTRQSAVRVGPFNIWQAGLIGIGAIMAIGVLLAGGLLGLQFLKGKLASPDQTATYLAGLNGSAPITTGAAPVSALEPTSAVPRVATQPVQSAPLPDGSGWRRAADLPRKVNACATDPVNPLIAYCGTGDSGSGSGVYKSEDGGLTWQPRAGGLPMGDILAITIGSDTAQTIYALSFDDVFASQDGAQTWQILGRPERLYGSELRLYTAPGENAALYYLAVGYGMQRSTDGGQNWQASDAGLPLDSDGQVHLLSLAIDPSAPQVLYAGTGTAGGMGQGVYKSIDGGLTWSAVNQGMIDYRITGLAVDPIQPQTVYAAASPAALFKSVDGGATWTLLSVPLDEYANLLSVNLDPRRPERVYLLIDSVGLAYSPDAGATWQSIGKPIDVDYPSFLTLTILPGDQPAAFSGTRQDGGWLYGIDLPSQAPEPTPLPAAPAAGSDHLPSGVWQELGDLPRRVNAMTVDPSTPTTIYAATGENGSASGVYKSIDTGLTWVNASAGLPSEDILGIAVGPGEDPSLYAASNGQIFISRDGAASWTTLSQVPMFYGWKRSLIPSPLDELTVYLLAEGSGLAVSSDGGQNWQELSDGLPKDSSGQAHLLSLALHPSEPDVLYLGTGDLGGAGHGVYKSVDGGQTWSAVNQGMIDRRIIGLAIDPTQPDTLYAVDPDGTLFKTLDGGLHWSIIRAPQPDEWLNVIALSLDPTAPQVVYLLCDQIGVLYSPDGGVHWQVSGKPGSIDYPAYTSFAVAFSSPPAVLTGIREYGAWRLGGDG